MNRFLFTLLAMGIAWGVSAKSFAADAEPELSAEERAEIGLDEPKPSVSAETPSTPGASEAPTATDRAPAAASPSPSPAASASPSPSPELQASPTNSPVASPVASPAPTQVVDHIVGAAVNVKAPVHENMPEPEPVVARPPDPARLLTCCKITDSTREGWIGFDLFLKKECVSNADQDRQVMDNARMCREDMKCCKTQLYGTTYANSCPEARLLDEDDDCEKRKPASRTRACCVLIDRGGEIHLKGWIQRSQCHAKGGQVYTGDKAACQKLMSPTGY